MVSSLFQLHFIALIALSVAAQPQVLPLFSPTKGYLGTGDSQTYSIYVPPTTDSTLAAKFLSVNCTNLSPDGPNSWGYYQVQLSRDVGGFSQLVPGTNSFDTHVAVSSEEIAGDASGYWTVTVTLCSGCNNEASSSIYVIYAQLQDLFLDRTILVGTAESPGVINIPEITLGYQFRFFTAYVPIGSCPAEHLCQLYSSVKVTSDATAFAQLRVRKGALPGDTYDLIAPGETNEYTTQTGGLHNAPASLMEALSVSGRYFFRVGGCGGCQNTNDWTQLQGVVSVWMTATPNENLSLNDGIERNGSLTAGTGDIYTYDIPTNMLGGVNVTVSSTSSQGSFIVYWKSGEIATVDNYDTSSGGCSASASLLYNSTSAKGVRGYIRVQQCTGGVYTEQSYVVHAEVQLPSTRTHG